MEILDALSVPQDHTGGPNARHFSVNELTVLQVSRSSRRSWNVPKRLSVLDNRVRGCEVHGDLICLRPQFLK